MIQTLLGKLILQLARLTRRPLSPVGIGRGLYQKLFRRLRGGVGKSLILVLGTTGKTGTKHLIRGILEKEGQQVLTNGHGKREYQDLVASLVDRAGWGGGLETDYLVLEANDLGTLEFLGPLTPDYVVVTNLFMEQLARKTRYNLYVGGIRHFLESLPDAILVLNGDDPVTVGIGNALPNRKVYYGLQGVAEEGLEEEELFPCPACGRDLTYSYRSYGQLGDFLCPHCGFDRPALDYEAANVTQKDGIYFDFLAKGEEYPFDLEGKGVHNIYNLLAALSLAEELDLGIEAAELALEEGEDEEEELSLDTFYIRKPVFLTTADSLADFRQALLVVEEEEVLVDLLFLMNEEEEEEKNTFFHDAPLQLLGGGGIGKVVVAGERACAFALALRYAGVPPQRIQVEEGLEQALSLALSGKGNKLYVINKDDNGSHAERLLMRRQKKWSLKN